MPKPKPKDAQLSEQFNIRFTKTLLRRIERAAKTAGLAPSDWVRYVLARAANEGVLAPSAKPKKEK